MYSYSYRGREVRNQSVSRVSVPRGLFSASRWSLVTVSHMEEGRKDKRRFSGLASSPSHVIMHQSIHGAEAGWLHLLLKGLILFYVIIPPQWRLSSSINSGWSRCIQITGSLPEEWSRSESRRGLEFVWLKKGGEGVSVWGRARTKAQYLQKEGNIKYGSINKNCGSIRHGARARGGVSGGLVCALLERTSSLRQVGVRK